MTNQERQTYLRIYKKMVNSIYFALLLALFGIVCYMIPQAFDKSFANNDNGVSIHKIEYINMESEK